jgi:hypothetical protein
MMIIISYRFSIAVGERGGHFRLPTTTYRTPFFCYLFFGGILFPGNFLKRLGRKIIKIFHQHSDRGNKLLYDDIICLHDNYTFVLYLVEEEYNTPFVSVCVCVCVQGGMVYHQYPGGHFYLSGDCCPGEYYDVVRNTQEKMTGRETTREPTRIRSWG